MYDNIDDSSKIAEGYLVYNIDLENGFKLKGTITHEFSSAYYKIKNYYSTHRVSELLRGLYIGNNLFTVSETEIKASNIDTLQLISSINVNEEKQKNGGVWYGRK